MSLKNKVADGFEDSFGAAVNAFPSRAKEIYDAFDHSLDVLHGRGWKDASAPFEEARGYALIEDFMILVFQRDDEFLHLLRVFYQGSEI